MMTDLLHPIAAESRAGEFNRIAEAPNGAMIMAIGMGSVFWTQDRDLALRVTSAGRAQIKAMVPMAGFRTILAG